MRGEPFSTQPPSGRWCGTTWIAPAAARRRPKIRSVRASSRSSKLIAEGLTSEEIAEQLFISKKTVDRHRANVLEKLGMRNRVELTRYAIRRGLVVP